MDSYRMVDSTGHIYSIPVNTTFSIPVNSPESLEIARSIRDENANARKNYGRSYGERLSQPRRGYVRSTERVRDYSDYVFISPEGKEYQNVINLSRFCREHDLHSPTMCALVSGKRNIHKGWTVKSLFA